MPAEARTSFQIGVAALQEGRYRDALEAFLASYRLNPTAVALYNIGMCQRELDDPLGARDNLRRYLDESGADAPAHLVENARRVVTEIEAGLGRVAVEVSDPSAVVALDGEDLERVPLPAEPVFVLPGSHVLEARAAGLENARATVDVPAGELVTVRLGPADLAASGVSGPGEDGAGGGPAGSSGGFVSNPWFWTAVGITAGAGLAAIVTGSLGLAVLDDYESGGAVDGELRQSSLDLALATDVLIGVTAAAAVAGLVILLVDDGEEEARETPPADVAFGPGSLVLTW